MSTDLHLPDPACLAGTAAALDGADDATYLAALDAFLRAHRITHFSAREVCPLGRTSNGVRLSRPPVRMWANIVPTLQVWEWVRARLDGRPVLVTSGWRDPAYNRAIGGSTGSLHTAFSAVDAHPKGLPPVEAARIVHDEHPHADQMGLGGYTGFVHVDTRGLIGRPAPRRWPGSGVGEWWS